MKMDSINSLYFQTGAGRFVHIRFVHNKSDDSFTIFRDHSFTKSRFVHNITLVINDTLIKKTNAHIKAYSEYKRILIAYSF